MNVNNILDIDNLRFFHIPFHKDRGLFVFWNCATQSRDITLQNVDYLDCAVQQPI